MSTPIIKDILKLLDDNKTVLGLPEVVPMPDLLPETGDGVSVSQVGTPKTETEFLNGTKRLRLTFAVLVRTDGGTNGSGSLKAVTWLEAVSTLFEGMKRFQLSDTRNIITAATSTPSLVSRDQTGRVTYSVTVETQYTETEE